MTTLEDKAKADDDTEFVLARDLPGAYVLAGLELEPADDLGTDEFPQYGDFLPVQRATGNMEALMLECPGFLASELVEQNAEPGDEFRVKAVDKVEGGRWNGTVTVTTDDSKAVSLETAAGRPEATDDD